MSGSEWVAVIAACGALVGTFATAVATIIVALRTGRMETTQQAMKLTGEETHAMADGHNTQLRALVNKQAIEMDEGGLPPTVDDAFPEKRLVQESDNAI